MDLINPAWDYIQTVPYGRFSGHGFEPFEMRDNGPGRTEFVGHRSRVTATWTWAIPNPDAVKFIVDTLAGRPLVEMGAGNGYWASLLDQSGVDVTAYDRTPWGTQGAWFGPDSHHAEVMRELRRAGWMHESEEFFPVTAGDPSALKLPENKDRVLFLCWPSYSTNFAYNALRSYGGDTLIYIGEPPGGCTADDDFHALTTGEEPWQSGSDGYVMPKQEWDLAAEGPLMQWDGIHDRLQIFQRRKP